MLCFLQVIWKYFYDTNSGAEHGTLYQLRNLINCNDVGKIPKSNFNSCEDFLQIVLTAHILSAACEILDLSSLDDQPSADVLGMSSPENLWTHTDHERKAILTRISKKIVEKFSFNANPNNAHKDEVHKYACYLLSIGCFYLAYKDAIQEGDGERVLECWHYFVPIFHNAGRRNYANEAFIYLSQHFHDLPPQQAQQLLYSKFINTAGVRGRNIPLDLHQEHLNRLCKDCVKGLGSNKTKENIIRCSKAMGVLHDFLANFDKLNEVSSTSGAHSSPSFKEDVKLILNELNTARVFSVISNDRKHQSFQRPKDILHAKDKEDIITYVSDHLKKKYFKN